MVRKLLFKFYATVSDRGQIFIPKTVQEYFGIKSRDKVVFMVNADGSVVFERRKEMSHGQKGEHS